MNKNKIDIVIISYNTRELTIDCIRSAIDTAAQLINQIVLVDNASSDGTVEAVISGFPLVRIIANEKNKGFSAAVNQGFRASSAGIIFVSNTDVVFHKDTIRLLASRLQISERCGIVGGQQIFPNGKWQRSYGEYPSVKHALKDLFLLPHLSNLVNETLWDIGLRPRKIKTPDYIDGALMAISREAYDEVGGFDESYFFYTEEADFCRRLKEKGRRVEYFPPATLTHLRGGGGEANVDTSRTLFETKAYFVEKHYSKFSRKLFIAIETLHVHVTAYLLKFTSVFTLGRLRKKIKSKTSAFEKYCAAWREILQNS